MGHAIGSISAGYIYSKNLLFGMPSSHVLIIISSIVLLAWAIIGIPIYNNKRN
jgi:hypothetical protein